MEWTDYADNLVKMRIPKRLKKAGKMLFFKGRIERLDPKSELMMAIQLDLPSTFVDVIRRGSMEPSSPDMMGTICTYHNRGESTIRSGGYEVKLTQTVPEARGIGHRWAIAFPTKGKWVQLDIANGRGGLGWEKFEAICSTIIESFGIVQGGP
jgi:hypothetical protein